MELSTAQIEQIALRVADILRGSQTKRYYSIAEAATLVGISPRTLRDRHEAGTGPKVTRVGRLVRFEASAISDWLAANQKRRGAAR